MNFLCLRAPSFAVRTVLMGLLVVSGLGHVTLAFAAPPAQQKRVKASAKIMAEQAGKAYEGGDFQRAALLYYNAWQTDDATPDYLFAAARAAHVGGLLDIAVAHYEEFLKTPGIDAARDKKARGYLDDIRDAKAAAKGQEAEKAQRAGDNNLAAQLYLQAWQIAPHRPEYRFKSAVVLQAAGQTAQADALFRAYLADAPQDAVDRPEATARLASLQGLRAPVATPTKAVAVVLVPQPAAVKPQPASPVTATAPQVKGPSRVAGWLLTVAGVGLLVGAGVAASTQYTDTQAYENPAKDPSGLITNRTAAEGAALADKIDRNRVIAGVCGALGVTSLALGIWQLVRTPAATETVSRAPSFMPTFVPTLGGAAIAGRF